MLPPPGILHRCIATWLPAILDIGMSRLRPQHVMSFRYRSLLLNRRSLDGWPLIMLPRHGVVRLVTVMLMLQHLLLFHLPRVAFPRILSLVGRKRGGCGDSAAV